MPRWPSGQESVGRRDEVMGSDQTRYAIDSVGTVMTDSGR